jgi:hypothetical protein
MLPKEFADLEPFAADWCLPTEAERQAKRLSSDMAEIQAVYEAVTARAKDALAYLDQFSLEELPEDATNLMLLMFSWCTVSFAVECWRQPRIPDSGASELDLVSGPALS